MRTRLLTSTVATLVLATAGDIALAQPCSDVESFLDCVSVDAVRMHQAALQAIADAHNGYRTSGTPGYDASVDYVVGQLVGAGYDVTIQPFQYQAFIVVSPSVLEQTAPPPTGPIPHSILGYSGSGDHTAAVAQPSPIRGCNAADWAGFPPGQIALVERGDCTFAVKATNAYNAGAVGVVLYNNIPGPFPGSTLGSAFALDVSVVGISQTDGQTLATTPGLVLHLETETLRGLLDVSNVIAETPGGSPGDVMMFGAHLDSVNAGPGIQDNGSGSAVLLETALQLAPLHVQRKVRFAWWGAHEGGLIGSNHYVANLSPAEIGAISGYVDAFMLGSPNYVYFVLDGDDSDGVGGGPGPPGSAEIEALFQGFYAARGLPTKGYDLSGTSDYNAFGSAGIAIGGPFAGSFEVKTPEEAALWGGTAGEQYDPCFHLACDTYDNVSLQALDVNTDAIAYAVFQAAGVRPTIQAIPTASEAGLFALALLLAGAALLALRRG